MSALEPAEKFKFGERLGVFIMVESASLSAIAVTLLLTYVGFKSLTRYRARRAARNQMFTRWMNAWQMAAIQATLERTDDASDSSFFICLMLAELVQAVGGLLNIQWVIDGAVTEGSLCTAQGALKQLGDVSVAFMSLCIAFQTFSVLILRWHAPVSASKYIIAVVFLFIALMQGISVATRTHSSKGPYYGNTGFWCWIGDNYMKEKIIFEYLWMWLAGFIMLIIYGMTAIVMRGILVVGDESERSGRWGLRWNWSGRKRTRQAFVDDNGEEEEERQAKAIANLMLFYPAVYIVCVFPVGLVRWLAFSGKYVPPGATIISSIVFSLSGLLNTILYVTTRPELVRGSLDREETSTKDRKRDKPTEKQNRKSPAHRRHAGHLPDRGDDGGNLYLEDLQHRDASDNQPWLAHEHSRTDSGYAYPASPVSSPERILLGHLPSTSDASGSIYRPGSSSSEAQKHRQLLSLDAGHLPDLELDHDTRFGEGLQGLPIPHVQGHGRRGDGLSQGLEGVGMVQSSLSPNALFPSTGRGY
ncbi:hypothetical protein FPV67DRAFT_1652217 [Lyophyllum atratum]|nr:hypothetical protein FPV67DRAFT_1652217 [Lyophyllum atratum]